jgi:hypothetical protein
MMLTFTIKSQTGIIRVSRGVSSASFFPRQASRTHLSSTRTLVLDRWGKDNRTLAPTNIFRRWKSSSSSKDRFQLDALPFSISPEQALEKFREWAEVDQGLRYLLSYNSVRIGGAYVPVWSFDLNVRFAKDWKPPMFSIYDDGQGGGGGGDTIHLPGLSAYAGYSYRRSLVNPVHSTSLVFLGDQTQPFGGWMLRDMVLESTGASVSVIPDAWNATQGRALNVVTEELQGIVDSSWPKESKKSEAPQVKTQVIKSRRVYMPTFVIEYKILGLEYKAFVSGCDQGAGVAGSSHQVMGDLNLFESPEFHQTSRNFLTWSSSVLRLQNAPFLIRMLRPLLTVLWFGFIRIWAKIPVIGLAGGVVAGYRKIYQPWMDARTASADWERQREHEARMEEDEEEALRHRDAFYDSGASQRYFYRHREQILRHLSGDYAHKEGGYDWYKDWQQWAEQQWQQQQKQQAQQQQQGYQQQQQTYQRQQQQTKQRQQKKKTEYHFDFDANDPYSVLGIKRGATKQEVSQAFRTQMLKHHPDTQPNATEAQKERLGERSKFITEAYRKIKSEMKR